MSISNTIKLGILVLLQIPSISCHILLIYHLIFYRQLRGALHNHVILVFLIFNCLFITIDLSMTDHFLRKDRVEEQAVSYCLAWNFIDSFSSGLLTLLMTWASFERHLIIFYNTRVFNTNFKRFIFHYIPILLLVIYTLIFYITTVFISPTCSNSEHFNYDEIFCDRSCYVHEDLVVSSIDFLIHKILCSILILVFNLFLLIRVLIEKRQRNQIIRWRKYKRLAIQMLSISTLYLIGILPAALSETLHIFQANQEISEIPESVIQEDVFLYLFYFISLIIPFICLISFSEVYHKFGFLKTRQRPRGETTHMEHSLRQNQIGIAVSVIKAVSNVKH